MNLDKFTKYSWLQKNCDEINENIANNFMLTNCSDCGTEIHIPKKETLRWCIRCSTSRFKTLLASGKYSIVKREENDSYVQFCKDNYHHSLDEDLIEEHQEILNQDLCDDEYILRFILELAVPNATPELIETLIYESKHTQL